MARIRRQTRSPTPSMTTGSHASGGADSTAAFPNPLRDEFDNLSICDQDASPVVASAYELSTPASSVPAGVEGASASCAASDKDVARERDTLLREREYQQQLTQLGKENLDLERGKIELEEKLQAALQRIKELEILVAKEQFRPEEPIEAGDQVGISKVNESARPSRCAKCNKALLTTGASVFRCGRCDTKLYCSRTCKKADSKKHKRKCKPARATSAAAPAPTGTGEAEESVEMDGLPPRPGRRGTFLYEHELDEHLAYLRECFPAAEFELLRTKTPPGPDVVPPVPGQGMSMIITREGLEFAIWIPKNPEAVGCVFRHSPLGAEEREYIASQDPHLLEHMDHCYYSNGPGPHGNTENGETGRGFPPAWWLRKHEAEEFIARFSKHFRIVRDEDRYDNVPPENTGITFICEDDPPRALGMVLFIPKDPSVHPINAGMTGEEWRYFTSRTEHFGTFAAQMASTRHREHE